MLGVTAVILGHSSPLRMLTCHGSYRAYIDVAIPTAPRLSPNCTYSRSRNVRDENIQKLSVNSRPSSVNNSRRSLPLGDTLSKPRSQIRYLHQFAPPSRRYLSSFLSHEGFAVRAARKRSSSIDVSTVNRLRAFSIICAFSEGVLTRHIHAQNIFAEFESPPVLPAIFFQEKV